MLKRITKLPLIKRCRVIFIEKALNGTLVYREVYIDRFRIGVGHFNPIDQDLLDNYFVCKIKQSIAHLHEVKPFRSFTRHRYVYH